MSRLGSLLVALSKDWLRNREAAFFALLFPIILLAIFGTIFGGGGAVEFSVYVQNNDVVDGEPTEQSAALVEAMNETDVLQVQRIDSGSNLTAWSESTGGTKRVVVLEDGFAERVAAGSLQARLDVISDTINQTGGNGSLAGDSLSGLGPGTDGRATVQFLSASDDTSAETVRGIVESIVARFNDDAIGVDEPPVTITAGSIDAQGQDIGAVGYFLPAFIAVVVMINGVITVTTQIAGFSADGTLKRLVATPLRRRDWILANMIHQSALALVMTGVMVVVARLLFGVTVVPGPLALVLVVLGAIAFSGVGMTLGSLVGDPDAATSLGNAIAFPLMFLSGVFWQLDIVPGFLQTVARVLPLYHFHQGLRKLMVVGTTEGVLVPFAVLGVGAVLSLSLAVVTTRWRDLG